MRRLRTLAAATLATVALNTTPAEAGYTTKDNPDVIVDGFNLTEDLTDDMFTNNCKPTDEAELHGALGIEFLKNAMQSYRTQIDEASIVDSEEMKGAILLAISTMLETQGVTAERIEEYKEILEEVESTNLTDSNDIAEAIEKLNEMRLEIAKSISILNAIKRTTLEAFLKNFTKDDNFTQAVQDELVARAEEAVQEDTHWDCGDKMNGLTGDNLYRNGEVPTKRTLIANRPEMPTITIAKVSVDDAKITGKESPVTTLTNLAEQTGVEIQALDGLLVRTWNSTLAEASINLEDDSIAGVEIKVEEAKK